MFFREKLCGGFFLSLMLSFGACLEAQVATTEVGDPNWEQLSFAGDKPTPRCLTSMAYDASNSGTLLFGGVGINQSNNRIVLVNNDTWSLVYDAEKKINSWNIVIPSTDFNPGQRESAAMASNPIATNGEGGEPILFGGFSIGFLLDPNPLHLPKVSQNYQDTWTCRSLAWSIKGSGTPSMRGAASMVYYTTDSNANTGEYLLFGGKRQINNSETYYDEIWSYNPSSTSINKWTPIEPSGAIIPSARAYAAMASDPTTNQIVLFGGVGAKGVPLNDTFIYDVSLKTWTQLNSDHLNQSPPARSGAVMVYDPNISYDGQYYSFILFGGNSSSDPNVPEFLGDTWAFRYDALTGQGTWTELSLVPAPTPRAYASAAFNNVSKQVIVFGGLGADGYLGDTWALNGSVLPPNNVVGFQVQRLATAGFGFNRAKRPIKRKRIENVLTWSAPLGGVPIKLYRIFRDKDLKDPIADIPSVAKLEFKQRDRRPFRNYRYYIVSVDFKGNTSAPAFVEIKGKRRNSCQKKIRELESAVKKKMVPCQREEA